MFLGILTSRYSENDFLVALPNKLMFGLVAMFFSIASMIVAFGATIIILCLGKLVIIAIALFCCIPMTLFALFQFPLLVEIYSSTYRSTIFKALNGIKARLRVLITVKGGSQFKIKAILRKDNCLAAIGGVKPSGVTDDKWKEMDDNAMSNLHLALADSVLSSVAEKESAKEIWDALTRLYKVKSLHN
ncbi:hypothetical protein Pint_29080 [Pistacia integerrima]|uniref:Uncharacterized protein n=1 Tax=Pistacia integerrima TaxID=434235 RepID=A0ACC0X0X2_9ROSI|nr:hypothetical protein Pint_29080 [Pistacia integerrima]